MVHSQDLEIATPVRFYPGLGFAPTIAIQPASSTSGMRAKTSIKQAQEEKEAQENVKESVYTTRK